jgi:putative peptidoglycan lipid II flippase
VRPRPGDPGAGGSPAEDAHHHRRLVRSTLSISLPTIVSRVLGYGRDFLQAYFLGTGRGMDAFALAVALPNIIRRLTAEGAMTAAFLPVFAHEKRARSREEALRFANAFFFDLAVGLILIVALGMIFTPGLVNLVAGGFRRVPGKVELTTALTRIMFPYVFFASLAALAGAILNSFYRFFLPALTPVVLNLAVIVLALVFARKSSEPAYVFAFGVVVGGLLQLGIQLPLLKRMGLRLRFGLSFTHPAVRQVARMMIPGALGLGIYQFNFIISRFFAASQAKGSVAALYFGSRVEELTLGIFSIALSVALLPALSDQAALGDIAGMKKTLVFSLKFNNLVTFPAAAGLLALSQPIMRVLFERGQFSVQSTAVSSACLFFFALGLPFLSSVKVLAPAFFSLKDLKTPVYISILSVTCFIGLNFLLIGRMHVAGIALALSISQVVNFFAYLVLLERKIGRVQKREYYRSLALCFVLAGAMGVGLWRLIKLVNFSGRGRLLQAGLLFGAIALGVLFYFGCQLLFNREEVLLLRGFIRRRRADPGAGRPGRRP